MTDQLTRPGTSWAVGAGLLAAGLAAVGGGAVSCHRAADPTVVAEPGTPAADPAQPFAGWGKPDAVLVLSGETFGYVQPCGCSKPQKGGLERRANFVAGLKAKGWAAAAVDLGDLYPDRKPIGPPGLLTPPEQAVLKYKAMMGGLREMGYVAVGVGKTDLAGGLPRLTAEYALQKEQPPWTLAGNLLGLADGKPVPRADFFPPGPGGTRPLVGAVEVVDVGRVPVGVAGVVGKDLSDVGRKLDKQLEFGFTPDALQRAAAELAAHPKKPAVNVLLYGGSADHARAAAKDRPEFRVILCKADDPEPPQFPEVVAHPDGRTTQLIQVGHKGMYVGVVGVFNRPGREPELKYQLVQLGEEYLTPPGDAAATANPALAVLEEYARQVKDGDFLSKVTPTKHAAQVTFNTLNLSYVGAAKCAGCHPGEHAKWATTRHSHAYEALEKATRPGLRHLDPECVVCHTTGYGFQAGYQSAEKTPHLKHNGCENCHGPGSGHAAAERHPDLLKAMVPWRTDPADRLPDVAKMAEAAKLPPLDREKGFTNAEKAVINRVSGMCQRCHDGENDPHFDLYKYWPQVYHGGLKGK